jgi:hypothetical protein
VSCNDDWDMLDKNIDKIQILIKYFNNNLIEVNIALMPKLTLPRLLFPGDPNW